MSVNILVISDNEAFTAQALRIIGENSAGKYAASACLLKDGRKTIKKLSGGKKYYVRLCTFKKVKQNGEKFYINSNDSKAKTGKTGK